LEAGMSPDGRKLFAAIQRVEIIQMQTQAND
jgi:hypothetical protein